MKGKIILGALSDTHASTLEFERILDSNIRGDIFIFAGDLTCYGRQEYFNNFIEFLQALQFRHKIVVAGNHQIPLDQNLDAKKKRKISEKYGTIFKSREQILVQLKKHCIYLEHEFVEIQGIKIFGSPFTQKYSKGAFQYEKQYDEIIWEQLPPAIDILVTHSPPYGILDQSHAKEHAGSPSLRKQVDKIKPKFHIFGHIHESHGIIVGENTTFANVAKRYEQFEFEV